MRCLRSRRYCRKAINMRWSIGKLRSRMSELSHHAAYSPAPLRTHPANIGAAAALSNRKPAGCHRAVALREVSRHGGRDAHLNRFWHSRKRACRREFEPGPSPAFFPLFPWTAAGWGHLKPGHNSAKQMGRIFQAPCHDCLSRRSGYFQPLESKKCELCHSPQLKKVHFCV